MGIRVLYVENDTDLAEQMVPSLERNGFEVSHSRTQRQAAGRLRSQHFDLIVIDVASYGANGYKTLDAVRSKGEGAPIGLLVPKGHTAVGGAVDFYLTPPHTPRRLLHRLKASAERLSRQVLKSGPLSYDPTTRVLTKGGTEARLRPKEAALLAFLMRNEGRVLSRSELMRQVWDTEYMGDTRTLSVHICWLRSYIEDEPKQPRYLRTVRGIGYRFEVPRE